MHPRPHTHTAACTVKHAHTATRKCSACGREDKESEVKGTIKTDEKRRWRRRRDKEEEVVVEGEQGKRIMCGRKIYRYRNAKKSDKRRHR